MKRRDFLSAFAALAVVPMMPDIMGEDTIAATQSGWQRLPNGLLMCWGVTDKHGAGVFPMPFPLHVFAVHCCDPKRRSTPPTVTRITSSGFQASRRSLYIAVGMHEIVT